ncbi:MAG: response regulator [Lachnospiraceae bacterium]|nr:response regulator [Lachnospiraceae bacterium]
MAKVLVVDDDAMVRKMAAFILNKGNVDNAGVGSGEEAIELLKKENFDLVVLDIEMPQMGGIETLEIIRQDETVKDIKVIFMTGTIDEKTKSAAARLEAVGVIEKPLKPVEFMEIINEKL